jgi:hypothetical protein
VWDHSTFSKNRDWLLEGDCGQISERGGAAASQAIAVERAFFGGWHADRSVGFDQEFQAEGAAGH